VGKFTYWYAAAEPIAEILEQQTALRHACEAETSMMMALRPELVARDRIALVAAANRTSEIKELVGDGVHRWRTLGSISSAGVIGRPDAASAEKGERLLGAIARTVAMKLCNRELWSLRWRSDPPEPQRGQGPLPLWQAPRSPAWDLGEDDRLQPDGGRLHSLPGVSGRYHRTWQALQVRRGNFLDRDADQLVTRRLSAFRNVLTYAMHPYMIGRGYRVLAFEDLVAKLTREGAVFPSMESKRAKTRSFRAPVNPPIHARWDVL
jgi:Creatinine amidohydrolase